MIVVRGFIPGGLEAAVLGGVDNDATYIVTTHSSGCIVLLYQYFTFCRIETNQVLPVSR
jgi:hypothetical protein